MFKESVAKIITDEVPGPKSKALFKKRQKYVAKGIGNLTEIFIAEAKGAIIKDVDGNLFLDFAAGIGVQNIGHGDETIINALQEQAKKFIHPCFHVTLYDAYIQLAEKLADITPGNFDKKVMLANSGAEAVENTIKFSRKYTGKIGVLSLEAAFHGRTYMAMTLTSKVKPYKNGFGPFMSDAAYKIPAAYCYRCPFGSKYPACGIACAEKLRTLLKGELSGDMIAALIAEPVQGEGGFIIPPQEYLQALQSICREHDIVFILDEIQTGFARTGKMFAGEHFEIEPDIITLSKSIAAGIPLSAIVGRAEIMDAPNPGEVGGTFAGSPLGCVAALKAIDKIQQDNLAVQANKIGALIKSKLLEMKQKYALIGDVRGLGAMCAVEFVKDRQSQEPYPEIVKKITKYAFERGVIFISAGIFSNVIRFLPPLVMSEQQVAFGMAVLDEAIENCL
ncbi:MAG: 4-aminobutyrate--2-oxoglutarate transaminase [Desulfotomaculum sp.]|nr:4-aminobutyrate--2-oxoglutarate transaminase [Desulfotomaculum sp.]